MLKASKFFSLFILCLLIPLLSFAKTCEERARELPVCDQASNSISTLYGTFKVDEALFWELLNSPTMQRLKEVHQYGISYYVDDEVIQYSRYDHSVGVWALLRLYGASQEEQIAGLLHDASHTVFSHTGDHFFKKEGYQDDIHRWYLEQQGVHTLLKKYGITLDQVLPKNGLHSALERELPDLCADRIDYNIQEGLMNGLIDADDVPKLLASLKYENGSWYFTDTIFAKKLGEVSIYGSQNIWGGPNIFMQNQRASHALHYAIKQGILTLDDIHFSCDRNVWTKLQASSDPELRQYLYDLVHYKSSFQVADSTQADLTVRTKLRAIDPQVMLEAGLARLSAIDADYAAKYQQAKHQTANGWPIKLH